MIAETSCLNRSHMRQRQTSKSETTVFGEWLREARAGRGYTMEALAEIADTAAAVISNLERGTRNPSRGMVRRLAAALTSPAADDHTAEALLNSGLKAAGFATAPTDATATTISVPTSVIEFFDGVVSEEEAAFVLKTIEMISNARSRIPSGLGK